jgi:DNA-binding transcriptional LysR family regulator
MLNRVDDLVLLSHIAEAGSFTEASRATGITKSRLSRRLSELEESLGIRLIERTSRSFRVTELGLRLSQHGLLIRAESDAATALIHNTLGEPMGALCVACPVVLSELIMGDVAARFAIEHPRVQLTFDATSGVHNVEADRYDLVFRASPSGLPDSDVIARQLMLTPYELVAAPEWVREMGHPSTPADLENLEGIGWWQSGAVPRWLLLGPGGERTEIHIKPRLQTNNLDVAKQAALAGLGMARLPRPLCLNLLASGRLQRVIPTVAPAPMAIYVVYPTRRSLTPAGRKFLEMVEIDLAARADEGFLADPPS